MGHEHPAKPGMPVVSQTQHPRKQARFARAFSCRGDVCARIRPARPWHSQGTPPLCPSTCAAETTSPLPRNAARLLVVMFSRDDVCRQSLEALEGEGFSRGLLPGMLRALIEDGLVSKQVGSARIPNTYRLLLSAKADAP